MAFSNNKVALSGSTRVMRAGAVATGGADPNEWVEVTIRLRGKAKMPSADELGAMLPGQRKYLGRDEVARAFGARAEEIAKVEQFVKDHGLTLVSSDAGKRTVTAAGTAEMMAKTFGVKLMRYRSGNESYRGRMGNIMIPAELKGIITGVFGLDNRRQARPRSRIVPLPVGTSHATEHRAWFIPNELETPYAFPPGDGAGQCIALLEFGGGFDTNDLTRYFQTINRPQPQVVAVPVNHHQNNPGADPDEDGEVMQDIEVAGALAPAAKLAVYFSTFTEKGWVDAITTAVHDDVNKPSVISVSWGFAEGNLIWTEQAIDAVNEALQAAALMGVSICVASGDDGSSDDVEDGHAHVDFPASSPFVLAVGGTTLAVKNGKITDETVWNGGPRDGAGGAGGGGVSDAIDLPAWQQGFVKASVNPGGRIGRGVPDVAAVADPNTGYFVLSGGKTGIAGGTSAAAPLWAALLARINQKIGTNVGYFNPLLYQKMGNANVCRDITTGNNDTQGLVGGYPAGKGWDACTGFGSPIGTALASGFVGAPTKIAAMGVAPEERMTAKVARMKLRNGRKMRTVVSGKK